MTYIRPLLQHNTHLIYTMAPKNKSGCFIAYIFKMRRLVSIIAALNRFIWLEVSPHAVSVSLCNVYLCVSVTFVDCVKTRKKHIFKIFHIILVFFFCTKRHGNILTGTPLTRALNAGEVGRNLDS